MNRIRNEYSVHDILDMFPNNFNLCRNPFFPQNFETTCTFGRVYFVSGPRRFRDAAGQQNYILEKCVNIL